MTSDREKQGREYVSDVLGAPWAEVAAAMGKLELDRDRRVDNPELVRFRERAWEAHMAAHRRAAEWWARNRPGAVVDPGMDRFLDGQAARCFLRGSCGQAEHCYCARTMWDRDRRPVEPVLAGELTESEVWKAGATVAYVNEALVREEMAKGPVRLSPDVAEEQAIRRYAKQQGFDAEATLRRMRDPAEEYLDALRQQVGPEMAKLVGKAGTLVVNEAGETVYEHVVGPVHPYFHWPADGVIPDRREYFNQVVDPDDGGVPPGTEPCV